MHEINGAGAYTPPRTGELNDWTEHFATADLSVGTYCIPVGGTDDQTPHTEDEIYLVTAGRAVLESGPDRVSAGPGSVLFVGAGEPHRFTDVTEDFAAIVVFGPAYGSRTAGARGAG